MSVFALDGAKLATDELATDVVGDDLLTRDRKESVAINSGHQRTRPDAAQSILDTAAVSTDIVRVHRFDEGDVRVCVEAAGELVAVEIEI